MEPVQFFLMILVKFGENKDWWLSSICFGHNPQSSPPGLPSLEGDLLGPVGTVHVGLSLLLLLWGPRVLKAADRTFSTGENPEAWRGDGKDEWRRLASANIKEM